MRKDSIKNIDLNAFECVKDKYNRIADGVNQGRAVYFDSNNQLYYKVKFLWKLIKSLPQQ